MSATPTPPPQLRERLRLAYFLAFASLGCFSPYLALYLGRRGLGRDDVAVLLTVVPLTRMVTPPLWGWLADRLGSPVPVLRGLALAASLAACGYFLVDGYHGLLAALVVQGLFHASVFSMLDAAGLALLAAYPGDDYGRVRALGSLGFLVGVSVGGWCWRGDGLLWLPAGLASMAFLLFLGAAALPVAPGRHEPPKLADVGALLRIAPLRGVLVVALLHFMVQSGYDLYFSVHCDALGLSTFVTGLGWSCGVLFEVLLLRRGTRLLERLGPVRLIQLGILGGMTRWVAVSFVSSAALLVPLQGLHALSFGAWFLGTITLVERLAPARLRASSQGLLHAALFGVGVALGARIWGHLLATRTTAFTFRAMAVAELLPLACTVWLLGGAEEETP